MGVISRLEVSSMNEFESPTLKIHSKYKACLNDLHFLQYRSSSCKIHVSYACYCYVRVSLTDGGKVLVVYTNGR